MNLLPSLMVSTTMGQIGQKTQQQTFFETDDDTLFNPPLSVQSEGTMPAFEMEDCRSNLDILCDCKKAASPVKQQLTMFWATGHRFLLFFDMMVVPTQVHLTHQVGCCVRFG